MGPIYLSAEVADPVRLSYTKIIYYSLNQVLIYLSLFGTPFLVERSSYATETSG